MTQGSITADKIRGHKFWPDQKDLDQIPALYATDGVDLNDKVARLHYFTGAADWWIFEFDLASGDAFGWCDLGFGMGEMGYVNLNELADVAVLREGHLPRIVERDLHFTPTRFGDLNDRTGR